MPETVHLERLSIVTQISAGSECPNLRRDLLLLHSGLRVLQLYILGIVELVLPPSVNGEDHSFVEHEEADEDDEPAPKRSKTTENVKDYILHTSSHLGHTWPSLERLDLANSKANRIDTRAMAIRSKLVRLCYFLKV